jgi:hypothetical protein
LISRERNDAMIAQIDELRSRIPENALLVAVMGEGHGEVADEWLAVEFGEGKSRTEMVQAIFDRYVKA